MQYVLDVQCMLGRRYVLGLEGHVPTDRASRVHAREIVEYSTCRYKTSAPDQRFT